jgi:hypothetical protein
MYVTDFISEDYLPTTLPITGLSNYIIIIKIKLFNSLQGVCGAKAET